MMRPLDFSPTPEPWQDAPDPDDRFNWYAITIILAAVACGVIAWGMV